MLTCPIAFGLLCNANNISSPIEQFVLKFSDNLLPDQIFSPLSYWVANMMNAYQMHFQPKQNGIVRVELVTATTTNIEWSKTMANTPLYLVASITNKIVQYDTQFFLLFHYHFRLQIYLSIQESQVIHLICCALLLNSIQLNDNFFHGSLQIFAWWCHR